MGLFSKLVKLSILSDDHDVATTEKIMSRVVNHSFDCFVDGTILYLVMEKTRG